KRPLLGSSGSANSSLYLGKSAADLRSGNFSATYFGMNQASPPVYRSATLLTLPVFSALAQGSPTLLSQISVLTSRSPRSRAARAGSVSVGSVSVLQS